MAKKPFLKLRRLYEDQGLLQKELSELSDIPLDTLKGRLNAPEDKGRWKAARSLKSARCYTFRRSRSGRISSRQSQRRKRRMKPYTLAYERAAAPLDARTSHRCFGTSGSVGEVVRHLAATSWADKSRMKATPGCRFLLMANGTLSSDGHWTTADPQSIVFRR